jgi:hypothetical protein
MLFCRQDWLDIDFAIREGVDFIAVSFVKSADVIKNLKSYLNARADKARSPMPCPLPAVACAFGSLVQPLCGPSVPPGCGALDGTHVDSVEVHGRQRQLAQGHHDVTSFGIWQLEPHEDFGLGG